MAQLPHLGFEQKPPMTSGAFISLAQDLMNKTDTDLLEKISLGFIDDQYTTGCKFIDTWQEWERTLRLNAAKNRSARLHRDTLTNEPPYVPQDAAAAASKAVNSDCSPLEGEIIIDRARWNAIDELAGTDYFSRNHVFAYLLKLLLLERREAQNAEKGFSEYKSLYTQIIEDANNSLGETV
ncbi:MAG: DUF2764 family protein [Treponema sp.]|jgi:hypothetical protein|nr:DUF2764 family protein [Treponema sp.]